MVPYTEILQASLCLSDVVLTALLQEAHAAHNRGTACLPAGSGLKVTGQRSIVAPQLFKHKEFNFEKLGIGGLDIQFEQIFGGPLPRGCSPQLWWSGWASGMSRWVSMMPSVHYSYRYVCSPAIMECLGVRHVKAKALDALCMRCSSV